MPDIAQLEQMYGPLAKHSDYKVGKTISYLTTEGERRRGEIIWVCQAGNVVGMHCPLQYLVSVGNGGFPDVIVQTDIEPVV